ncbi:MAG TPA: nucleotidyltransferase family protein [Gemmatimonadaceae bacterium]
MSPPLSRQAARARRVETRRLLVALCRRAPGPPGSLDAVSRLDDGAFRAELLARAASGRVLALALHALERLGLTDTLEAGTARALRAAGARPRVRAAAQAMEHQRVVAQLASRAVEVVLLKGAALRHTVYRRPEERYTRDLDLLVAPARVAAAVDALAALGYTAPDEETTAAYQRHHFHLQLRHPRGHLVELHWALTEPDSPVRLDAAAMLRDAHAVRGLPPTARVPATRHLLLHLAVQSATDGTRPFARIVDVDRLVAATPALDWDALVAEARRAGVSTALGADLAAARALLGAPVPADVVARLRPGPVVRAHLALLRPARYLLGVAPPADSELRLLQLWTLAGDHGVAAALRWLETQGFAGPVGRAAREAQAGGGRGRALARLKLGAYQVTRYAALLRR